MVIKSADSKRQKETAYFAILLAYTSIVSISNGMVSNLQANCLSVSENFALKRFHLS